MMQRPIFRPHYRVETVPDEAVFLLSEAGHHVLTGRIFQLIAPLIDGRKSPDDIVDCVEGKVPSAEVYYAVSLLEKKGYLIEADTAYPLAAFWTARGIDPRTASERLGNLRVSVTALGGLQTEPFVSALETFGIILAEDGALRIVLTDDYLRAGLEECNEKALRDKKPWMVLKPSGIEIFIGPLFVPDKTGCWGCLRDRHILSREVERFVMDKTGRKDPVPIPRVHSPSTLHAAYDIAASEIAAWIAAGKNAQIEGSMLSVDTRTWESRRHTLSRLTFCPICGKAPKTGCETLPVLLRKGKASFTRDGGYRNRTPEETLKKFDHLLSPITGIVSFLERDESLDGTVHVYFAGRNLAMRADNVAFLKKGLRNVSGGKGMSEAQARVSGLCEAIERHSGLFQGYETRITSTLAQLGDRAIHPNTCMLFSEIQYLNRAEINARRMKYYHVPEPFEDESLEIEWSPVWSLTHETFKYVPTQYLYFRYVYPDAKRVPLYFQACSNGAASGNSLEEAVLQGFLELVERDSVALWWYNMLRKPAVDLTSFEEPYFAQLASYYGKGDREIWALDITSDLGIPAFAAVSARRDTAAQRLIFGFGCHLDAKIALQRALTEMNQSLPLVRQAFDENNAVSLDFGDHEAVEWWKTATCENQPYMVPDKDRPLMRAEDYTNPCSDDLLDNILLCRKIVEKRGMEVLVLDQTRPDIGVPVVKVIVPGLRHFWARFAPGRLYEVPVQVGWLKESLREEQLNPIALFF